MAHELYSTKDGKYVYAQSWGSGHLVKIATSNDKVVKAFSKQMQDGTCPMETLYQVRSGNKEGWGCPSQDGWRIALSPETTAKVEA
jgi:hypothetical protein